MVPVPALTARTALGERIWNMTPFTVSVILGTAVLWAPLHPVTALMYAVAMTTFFIYWVVRSYSVTVAVWIGQSRIRRWQRTDWLARYDAWVRRHPQAEAWSWPRHVVIIPNYKEDEAGLARTIGSLAAQGNARQLVVILAMEGREAGADLKAGRLVDRFGAHFDAIFPTFHPFGLPGDTPGKGSNEAWAARGAFSRLIVDGHEDMRRYTITSCDADALFDPHHFEALNFLFLSADDRYRTFWQPTIFNTNNIWDTPAPLRIPDGLSGINRTANIVLPVSIKFPTSCYSLSWVMLHTVDYWDEEVIPEDWHLFLKCSFALGDRVHVEGLYLPLGNDCVLTEGYWKTLKAHYEQAKRHAWGASDIPYAWRALLWRDSPLSLGRGLLLAGALGKTHILWVAQWYLVTLGIVLPSKLAAWGAPMPEWWTHKAFHIPGPGWHLENLGTLEAWTRIGKDGVFEPSIWLNLNGLFVALCILPLFVLIWLEGRTRPPRPSYVTLPQLLGQYALWPAMAIITFFWASMPALHAQWLLFSGRGLIYIVAEKGRRAVPTSTAIAPPPALALPPQP